MGEYGKFAIFLLPTWTGFPSARLIHDFCRMPWKLIFHWREIVQDVGLVHVVVPIVELVRLRLGMPFENSSILMRISPILRLLAI